MQHGGEACTWLEQLWVGVRSGGNTHRSARQAGFLGVDGWGQWLVVQTPAHPLGLSKAAETNIPVWLTQAQRGEDLPGQTRIFDTADILYYE